MSVPALPMWGAVRRKCGVGPLRHVVQNKNKVRRLHTVVDLLLCTDVLSWNGPGLHRSSGLSFTECGTHKFVEDGGCVRPKNVKIAYSGRTRPYYYARNSKVLVTTVIRRRSTLVRRRSEVESWM